MSRRSVTGLMASVAVLAFTALPAVATAAIVPFNTTLNEGKLTLGAGASILDQPIVPTGEAISIAGTLDTTTGAIAIPVDGITFPPVTFTMPLPGTLTSTATAPATGTLNPATGAMTMDIQFKTVVALAAPVANCTIDPLSFSLTTGSVAGRYTEGSPLNTATGAVSLVGFAPSPTIPAATPNTVGDTGGCNLLNAAVPLPNSGSIELAHVVAAPGSPALGASFSPSKKKVKKNKKAKTTIKVTNTGTASATGVKVCVSGTGGVALGKKCFTDGTVAQGTTVSHKVSAKAKKSGKFKAKVTSTTGGSAKASAKVTVKKKNKRK